MVIKQILNNNIVSCTDELGEEVLLMGKGLGWQQKAGNTVDPKKAEKIFRMDTESETQKLRQLFIEVDEPAIRTAVEIVEYADEQLQKKLSKNIYITLTDHISFAVDRFQKGVTFANPLHWELQKYYAKEYRIGQYALTLIEKNMGVVLPPEEAGSIAIHIVNSEYGYGMERTAELTHFVQSCLDIIRYGYQIDFEPDSLDYQRFVTHLLFFAERVMDNKMLVETGLSMKDSLRENYPKEYNYAERIRTLTKAQYDCDIPDEEVIFLCIHIIRVTQSAGN